MSGEPFSYEKAFGVFEQERDRFTLKVDWYFERYDKGKFDEFDAMAARGMLQVVDMTAELYMRIFWENAWNDPSKAGQVNTWGNGGAGFASLASDFNRISARLRELISPSFSNY